MWISAPVFPNQHNFFWMAHLPAAFLFVTTVKPQKVHQKTKKQKPKKPTFFHALPQHPTIDQIYLDLTPDRETSLLSHTHDARGFGHLHSCVTLDVKSQIRCLGGMKVFLPLFAQVDQPFMPEEGGVVSYDRFGRERGEGMVWVRERIVLG